jgi:putative transposase
MVMAYSRLGLDDVDYVRDYIVNQAEHHKQNDFKTEYRHLLDTHGISYDAKYVWD